MHLFSDFNEDFKPVIYKFLGVFYDFYFCSCSVDDVDQGVNKLI